MSETRRTVSLVYVARNEEPGVRAVVPMVKADVFDDILAVDGNSRDGTRAAFEQMGVRTLPQDRPGLGAAMLFGRRQVRTDAFIFFHPDGNENPADLPRMAGLLREGHRFVVASRMIRGARNEEDDRFLRPRKAANKMFALLANLLFAHGGNRTTDVTNGFRGITVEDWDRMCLTSEDLTMDYQMVIRALKLGIPITEFPTAEGHRVGGDTNFKSIPTGIAELKLLWRELCMGARAVK